MSSERCGKVCYPNAAAAWRAIRALHRRRRKHGAVHKRLNRGARPDAYRCGPCNAWHITNERSI